MNVQTYDEFEDLVDMWVNGGTDFLLLRGRSGTGKTYAAREVVEDHGVLYVNTYTTPLALYKLLYEYRDAPIVIDDIEVLLDNKRLLSLLKQTGDTYAEKRLAWHSTTEKLDDTPQEFTTKSNVCIVCNELRARSLNMSEKALEDRALVVDFDPSWPALLDRMRMVARRYDRVDLSREEREAVLHRLVELKDGADPSKLNLRTLVKGFELLAWDGDEWEQRLEREVAMDDRQALVRDLLERHDTVEEAAKAFRQETGQSRSTFFRVKKGLTLS